jgi:hypothetical protein
MGRVVSPVSLTKSGGAESAKRGGHAAGREAFFLKSITYKLNLFTKN